MGWEQSRRPAGSSRRNSRSSESTPFRRATGRGAASPTTMVGMKSLRGVWLVIVVNTAGAVIPTILLQIFRPGATSHDMWVNFRFSLVYRSEEHTSELQSLRHLVCRLLLEKKK